MLLWHPWLALLLMQTTVVNACDMLLLYMLAQYCDVFGSAEVHALLDGNGAPVVYCTTLVGILEWLWVQGMYTIEQLSPCTITGTYYCPLVLEDFSSSNEDTTAYVSCKVAATC